MPQSTVVSGGARAMMEMLGRLEAAPAGYQVAVIALSQLQPEFRRPLLVRRATDLFEPLVKAVGGPRVYLPDSLDIVVIGKNLSRAGVRLAAEGIRTLFGADPLVRGRTGGGIDRFARWFDLGRADHHGAFKALADDIDRRSAEQAQATGAWDGHEQPLTPKRLALLISDMETLDVAPLLQRQPVIRVTKAPSAEIDFEEIFISLSALRKRVAEHIDLQSDRWLFQDFSRSLDRHILRTLKPLATCRGAGTISVNLNLETLTSDTFEGFVQAMPLEQRLIVEVQGIDVFADIGAFLRARDRLRNRGHRLLIDGLTPRTMETVDLGQLDADFYKLQWNPGFIHVVDGDEAAAARGLIGAIGAAKLVLSRVESEQAMTWGLLCGIRRFQGFFVDTLLGGAILGACHDPGHCTLSRCIATRRGVSGLLREQCRDRAALDHTVRIAGRAKRIAS
ncbi:Putative diguanylate phosphodiesterase (EAL domain) [Rhodospirillum rubrum ATCC 11170]|uniref:Diguanylate phosphodiesterase (EAL domain) n=2 Tax=Rhodospirillum rubrum TaxID=1085 RepID=Q2RY66_RHORT|nr:EAL domain-containing protein [Rhodospirillum rubrum]ABC20929.1 Putative diguanylate phosphodiesterase (EAL domain) [Rhodospirillum rubrum ATCC 11170]QXG80627.1 EAL domain-containing protein [Rhodospirillum rubrum]